MTIKKRSFNDLNKERDTPKHVVEHNKEEKYVINALRSNNTHSLLAHTEYVFDELTDWNY